MQRIPLSQLPQHVGERVRVAGWLHTLRQLKKVSFLILRDRTGTAQVVITDPQTLEQITALYAESVIGITATVAESPQAPNGVELIEPEITVISKAQEPPPFDLFRPVINAQLPTQLDYAPVTLRHLNRRAMFSISAATMHGFRRTLDAHGFTEIQTPKIVASATESGANVFEIGYFGKPAYLAQSPQFYKQMMVGVFERVYETGPVFRAEPHSTPRHLNEYVSLDLEFGFIEDHTTVMKMVTEVMRGMVGAIAERAGADVELTGIDLPEVPETIPAIHFSDALALIYQETGEDARHENDLSPTHERWLGEWALREHGSAFVFVVGYPMSKRPFYTHPDPARPEYSNSFDLLFRGLELVTGGQRLHRYEDYLTALESRAMSVEPFVEYLNAFKYGMPPHGGCAIGLERFVARLANIENVRETTLFPRDMQRLTP